MFEPNIQSILLLNSIKGENDLDVRVEQCQKDAERLVFGELEKDQDLFNRLRYILSRYYNIPYFSKQFDDLLLEQLIFEVCLINVKEKPKEIQTEEFIKDHITEAAALFDDFDDMFSDKPKLSEEEKKSIDSDMQAFKKGGFAAIVDKSKQKTKGENL